MYPNLHKAFCRRELGMQQVSGSQGMLCSYMGMLRRLQLEESLGEQNGRLAETASHNGHRGCVNSITFGWGAYANLMLSGSDDHTLRIWDVSGVAPRRSRLGRAPIATYETGHTSNILCARFVGGLEHIASCGMKGEVRLTRIVESAPAFSRVVSDHGRSAYAVESIPGEPCLFLSCGTDGHVRRYPSPS